VVRGIGWLLDLQNRDGGIPTFCRGWLNLPFDRSCPDITAHALAAWSIWRGLLPPPSRLRSRVDRAAGRALAYLCRSQRPDGTWVPLWFGNQHVSNQENPLYGTARVLLALAQLPPDLRSAATSAITRGKAWLLETQQASGGWGGGPQAPASIEETALALDALLACGTEDLLAVRRGLLWLLQATQNGTRFIPSPIGLYFARLWYSEELYPMIFSCSAFSRAGEGKEEGGTTKDTKKHEKKTGGGGRGAPRG
jgi:squalene-hopene/tetraprenyl-beta-curcumene cyclase